MSVLSFNKAIFIFSQLVERPDEVTKRGTEERGSGQRSDHSRMSLEEEGLNLDDPDRPGTVNDKSIS